MVDELSRGRKLSFLRLTQFYLKNLSSQLIPPCVHQLASEFIAGFDDKAAQGAIHYAEKVETTYKKADEFVENAVEPHLIDDISDTEIDKLSDISDDSSE